MPYKNDNLDLNTFTIELSLRTPNQGTQSVFYVFKKYVAVCFLKYNTFFRIMRVRSHEILTTILLK